MITIEQTTVPVITDDAQSVAQTMVAEGGESKLSRRNFGSRDFALEVIDVLATEGHAVSVVSQRGVWIVALL